MFRYEKPQKGRYRQFHQFDVEAIGYEGPDVDAELIILCAPHVAAPQASSASPSKSIRSGTPATRSRYRDELISYFSAVKNKLDEDSIRRLGTNPLRILDSKEPGNAGVNSGRAGDARVSR